MADGVDRGVADDDLREVGDGGFREADHSPEGPGIARPGCCSGIGEFVERDGDAFVEWSRAYPPEFFHVGADPEGVAQVNAERPDVGPGVASDPEEDEPALHIQDLDLLDLPDPEAALHRALSGGPLVYPAGELRRRPVHGLPGYVAVESHQTDVLLVVREEDRGESDGGAEHDDEHPGDLRVERSGVAHPPPEDIPDPGGHLVAARPPGLVDDDDPGFRDGEVLTGHPSHRPSR